MLGWAWEQFELGWGRPHRGGNIPTNQDLNEKEPLILILVCRWGWQVETVPNPKDANKVPETGQSLFQKLIDIDGSWDGAPRGWKDVGLRAGRADP